MFLVFNISVATMVTPGFTVNIPVKHFPIGNLNNQHFHLFIHENTQFNQSSVGKYANDKSILTLNPPPNLKLLFNQLNELTAESN